VHTRLTGHGAAERPVCLDCGQRIGAPGFDDRCPVALDGGLRPSGAALPGDAGPVARGATASGWCLTLAQDKRASVLG
jgi:hypothetical protein